MAGPALPLQGYRAEGQSAALTLLQLGQLLQDLLLQHLPSTACSQHCLDYLHLEEGDRGEPGADGREDERGGGEGGGLGGCGRRITVAVTAATALLCPTTSDHSTIGEATISSNHCHQSQYF